MKFKYFRKQVAVARRKTTTKMMAHPGDTLEVVPRSDLRVGTTSGGVIEKNYDKKMLSG